jgi:hypothetical protein
MLGVATLFSLLGATASVLGRVLLLMGGALIMLFGVMSLLGKGFTGMAKKSGGTANTLLRTWLFSRDSRLPQLTK